jgi:hypothetical protein
MQVSFFNFLGFKFRCRLAVAGLLLVLLADASGHAQQAAADGQRWTEAQADAWYATQPWPVGANFLPSTAINELEMWQADTFDPATIDRELGWAEGIGMNTMRVFLHNLLWEQDPKGFEKRMDTFLTIAGKHHIRPVFVLFDSCWEPFPKLGPQHPPIPGVHTSGWVQAPGATVLAENKNEIIIGLLPKVFGWARSAHPSQPLTSGLWHGDWTSIDTMPPLAKIQVEESDVISFHNYGWPEEFEQKIKQLQQFHRPLICTEYMARGAGSLFDTVLPVAHKYHVGAINWGLVQGRSQTYLPWDSWQHPYVDRPPTIWFHDVFHPDGTPYRQREVEIIRRLTSEK